MIDGHHHLIVENGYLERLFEACNRVSISKLCLSGLGNGGDGDFSKLGLGPLSLGNQEVLEAMKCYPDTIVGIGCIRLGIDSSEKVDELYQQGLRGLKTTRPLANYDDDNYLPIYQKAQELGMSILIHTGIVLVTPVDGIDDVSSDRMRPMLLDRVARKFPKVKIIMAHLGMPWHLCLLRFLEPLIKPKILWLPWKL